MLRSPIRHPEDFAGVAIFAACLQIAACVDVAVLEADRSAISMLWFEQHASYSSGDVEAFLSILTDDAVMDLPNQPVVVGKDAIRDLIEASFSRFSFDAVYLPDELIIEGDWAFDRGNWVETRNPKDGGDQEEFSFGILQIYRRTSDGSWKLARSVWSTNGPMFN